MRPTNAEPACMYHPIALALTLTWGAPTPGGLEEAVDGREVGGGDAVGRSGDEGDEAAGEGEVPEGLGQKVGGVMVGQSDFADVHTFSTDGWVSCPNGWVGGWVGGWV